MNDTQQGRVLGTWWITALVMLVGLTLWGQYLGVELAVSVGGGLLCVAVWLGLELYTWEPRATTEGHDR